MSLESFVKKWSCIIISNYFLLYSLNGFLGMVGLTSIAKLDLLIMLAATVITILYLYRQITALDAFIIFLLQALPFQDFCKITIKTYGMLDAVDNCIILYSFLSGAIPNIGI